MSKCPKCEKAIPRVKLVAIKAQQGTTVWNCVSYNCPLCDSILSVQIDPTIIREEIVGEIKALLRRRLQST